MRDETRSAALAFRFALPRQALSGRIGGRAGRGTGSSLELADFREYVPGDDPRHIDWKGYARTDKLHVRLFRAEVSPHLDVVLDLSASMGSTAVKERAVRDLGAAFRFWGTQAGCTTRILAAGGERVEDPETAPLSTTPLATLAPTAPRARNGLTVVISDFLLEWDVTPVVRRFAAESAHLWIVQVLDSWELEPTPDGARTFVDCETGERAAVLANRARIEVYRGRLARLRDTLMAATRAAGGTYALVSAAEPRPMFEGALLRQGVLDPA